MICYARADDAEPRAMLLCAMMPDIFALPMPRRCWFDDADAFRYFRLRCHADVDARHAQRAYSDIFAVCHDRRLMFDDAFDATRCCHDYAAMLMLLIDAYAMIRRDPPAAFMRCCRHAAYAAEPA